MGGWLVESVSWVVDWLFAWFVDILACCLGALLTDQSVAWMICA